MSQIEKDKSACGDLSVDIEEVAQRLGDEMSLTAEGFCVAYHSLLAERLKGAPKLVCRMSDGKWACDEHEGFARVTHTGRLVCINKKE